MDLGKLILRWNQWDNRPDNETCTQNLEAEVQIVVKQIGMGATVFRRAVAEERRNGLPVQQAIESVVKNASF